MNVDPNKFCEVIRNLLSNALKFCQKPGFVNVEVDVVPVSSYDYLNNTSNTTSLHSSKSNKKWNLFSSSVRNNQADVVVVDDENEDSFDYYLRLTVTDDGAGISEVRILESYMFLLLLCLMELTYYYYHSYFFIVCFVIMIIIITTTKSPYFLYKH